MMMPVGRGRQTDPGSSGRFLFMNRPDEAVVQRQPPLSAGELQRRLESAERLLACFGKAVGHELPSRLVAIQGLLRILETDLGDGFAPETREYLQRLSAVTTRAQTLVADLAELSRVGRDPQPPEPVNLAEVGLEAAAIVKQLFPGQPLEYHIAEGSPNLIVPFCALRQVLVQLLRHAVRTAAPDRRLRVEIGARARAGGVELRVADNGQGLPAECQGDAFVPFARAAGETDSGLGLFLVRHIVDGWGGTIGFHSEPGRGSTFTLFVRDL
jgi:two-component system sensor histidine kinase KdpD